jgi:hypothetical protein
MRELMELLIHNTKVVMFMYDRNRYSETQIDGIMEPFEGVFIQGLRCYDSDFMYDADYQIPERHAAAVENVLKAHGFEHVSVEDDYTKEDH